MGPKHHANFQEKSNESIPRKLTDRWKERQTIEWTAGTLFHRTLPATPGGPIRETIEKSQIKHSLTTLNIARAICWK